MIARGQDEIADRIAELSGGVDDVFGFRREALIDGLDFGHAMAGGWLRPDTSAALWEQQRADLEENTREYLDFAVGKILGHRGLSANRSVDKLREWAWLFGRDDVVKAMDAAPWGNYGAGKVKAFADGMGWAFYGDRFPREVNQLARMVAGQDCIEDCDQGCGR